jgi:hypothetical protein
MELLSGIMVEVSFTPSVWMGMVLFNRMALQSSSGIRAFDNNFLDQPKLSIQDAFVSNCQTFTFYFKMWARLLWVEIDAKVRFIVH